MLRTACLLSTITLLTLSSTAFALYTVSSEGTWPTSWPAELEALRSQARTYVGPLGSQPHHAIRFKTREEFEAAWPHLVTLKTQLAPLILVRGPHHFLGPDSQAGVVIHCAMENQLSDELEARLKERDDEIVRWRQSTFIELVVDGDIVDLNRIALPADTPILDQRFPATKEPSAAAK